MTNLAATWRKEFPILAQKNYLASHTQGAVPRATDAALHEFYEQWATLGVTAWEGPWWERVMDFGRDVEALLHAPKDTVVPHQNATRAMAAVASCFDYSGKRNRVVMTDLEFTTFYPFWRGQEALGAKLVIVESKDGVTVPADELAQALDSRTLVLATCHGYFRSGALQDVGALARAARDAGAYSLIDGYQVLGTVPVDVQRLGVDFYLGGSHKWLCGGAGAGYLYVRPDAIAKLRPRLTGWFGLANPFAFERDFSGRNLHPGVFRFLDGTPNVPALFAAREGIKIVRRVGVEAIHEHSVRLTTRLMDWSLAHGFRVKTPGDHAKRNGMVCIDFPDAKETTEALVRSGTILDWRPDCGMRVSPHFYNDEVDLDRFFEGVERRAATSRRPVATRRAT